MKVLIIQSNGEHNGSDGLTRNDYLRECFSIEYAFKCNNHTVDIWGKRHNNYNEKIDFNNYDMIFCIENYELDWIPDLSKFKNPIKVYWMIDLHCRGIEPYKDIIKQFDIILHSTKSLIDNFNILKNKKNIWFPNGVDDRYFYRRNLHKKYDLAFVGSRHPSRNNYINLLIDKYNLLYKFATGSDMIDIISYSKIHFNKCIGVDINYRIFETIGLGSCLLTNYNKELEELGFIDEYNCLLYKNIKECENKINKYIHKEYVDIAYNGNVLSLKNNYINRIKDFLLKI